MPSYNRWGSQTLQSRLPPTPPEYQTSFLTPMSTCSDEMQGYYSSQNYQRRIPGHRDYNDGYHRMSNYGAQHSHARSKHLSDYQMNYPQHVQASYQYAPLAAPILPPIRVTEDLNQFANHYVQKNEPKQKEEKPTGGVAQHLDYEMDLMASFVAEMSQQMVSRQNATPTPQFRKYVSQILSSTRLPSSTIMLGLFYLQERMKIEVKKGNDNTSSGAVYRMLTTCLLLGSKFLDDNTFQNRSWAEVSSIPVQELNVMELDWLKDFNWEIHGLMYDPEEGFFMWIEHWHAYEEKAQIAKAKELQKLAPINTNLSHRSPTHQPLMSPEGPIPPQYQQGAQYDTQWVRPLISEYSPPSAPHSGPTTPDYYGNNWSYGQAPESYTRSSWGPGSKPAYPSHHAHFQPYHAPFYGHGYQHSTWVGHGANCGCSLCGKQPDYYLTHPGYGLQTVVG